MAARGQRTTEHDGDGGEVQQQTRPPETVLILSQRHAWKRRVRVCESVRVCECV